MRQTIATALMIVVAFSLPIESSAKGPAVNLLVKDANGVTIGQVIGMETVGWPYVLTKEGYRTFFRLGNGQVSLVPDDGVFFESTNCEGQAYVNRGMFLGTVFSPTPQFGQVYDAGGPLYTPHDAQKVTVDIYSVLRDSNVGCESFVALDAQGYPAYPNDPDITGIKNIAYPTRMLIE